ncbi:MAG: hypothetical protein AMXMBFR16_12500 [Candidatus Uhrbacteria bacterium]
MKYIQRQLIAIACAWVMTTCATLGAGEAPQNTSYRIPRVIVNAGDQGPAPIVNCPTSPTTPRFRLFPNVAEAVSSADTLVNSGFRLRVGLLTPRSGAVEFDCNSNGIPDECEIEACPLGDHNCNDCNKNGIPDECDIANCPPGDSTCVDKNGNGIPDDCECACLDFVLLIDNTGSMSGAINNVKEGAASVLNAAIASSSADLRVGLITFKDTIDVRHALTTDLAAVTLSISNLTATAGAGFPEASDEALREMLSDTICPSTGDFDVPFRLECLKRAILITDALPAGCDDRFDEGIDDVSAMLRAIETAAAQIEISAVFVPTQTSGPFDAQIEAIMQDYASLTGGTYARVEGDGGRTGAVLRGILLDCPCSHGDVNDDKLIDFDDIEPFVVVLLDPISSTALQRCAADVNDDNSLDGRDISGFQTCVLGLGCP